MKSFKGYLKEGVAWQQSASKMVFDFGNKFSIKIPVSSAILDKVFPDKIRTTVFHVTDLKGGKDLIKLQNKKKSVSSFFFMDTNYLISGVKAEGGVIAELDGNVVVSAESDIMSMPDKSGRRWIELGTLAQFGAIEDDAVDMIYKLADKYNPDSEVENEGFGKYWQLQGKLVGASGYRSTEGRADPKTLSLVIKDYIDGMTAVLKKNKTTVEKALRDYSNKRVTKRSWDEQLVDQFTIQKIHLLPHQLIRVDLFIDMLKKKKIPYKDWDIDYAGLATYIRQVGEAEMRTMGTK